MARRLRVACLGTGYFSAFHYRAWRRLPEVDLVGICNRSRDSAEAFASTYAIPAVFTDLDTMLTTVRPDLLDIITPPVTHRAAIETAVRHGVDMICQKPFCETLADARAMADLAHAAGRTLVIHENFRFQPWYGVIAEALAGGALGQVYQASFRLRPGDGQGPRAYLDRQPYFQAMPRFLVHETAIHLIDVFRFLFGPARSVTALLQRLNPAIAGEDAGLIVLDMANGVRCVFDGNRLVDHVADNRRLTMGEMLIEGADGVLALDGYGTLSRRAHGANAWEPMPYPWQAVDFGGDCVFRLQRHVVDHYVSGTGLQNTARAYLDNLIVEDAVYASHRDGCRITL